MPSKKKLAEKHTKLYDETEYTNAAAVDNSRFCCLGNWAAIEQTKQPFPPTVPVSRTFPFEDAPKGVFMEYEGRITDAEAQAREATYLYESGCQDFRYAAEVHKQTRKYIQSVVQDGMTLMEIANRIEGKYTELLEPKGIKKGPGFPTGLSLNEVAAHFTPNTADTSIKFTKDDVCKVDFGVQVNGRIIDCAFTMCLDDRFEQLVEATREGTYTSIKLAGPDAVFGDISTAVHEVIASYELELDGKMKQVKPVTNLNGHTMLPYVIHAGKSLPCSQTKNKERMVEGEVYAIETFASTGRGHVEEWGECSHYMMQPNKLGSEHFRNPDTRDLFHLIKEKHDTLAFSRKWLDTYMDGKHYSVALHDLVTKNVIEEYPPLCDIKGCYTSQFEHTLWLKPTGKEVFSKGDDF